MDLTPEPGKDPKRNDLRAEVERLTSLMRTVDVFGTGFVWTDPRTGLEHMLHPADVVVVLRADTQTELEKIKEAAYRAGREAAARERTPEGPFERGELLTAERVEAVMLAAAQDALVASPDWTGGFRVPVSRWLTGPSETIEHGAAATDEHHGALALANLVLRGPYQAGREDAAREIEEVAEEAGWGEIWAQCVSLARGSTSLGRYVQGDGDSPEKQR